MKDPMEALGRALGMTAGQAWTVVLGLLLSCALLTASLDAVVGGPAPAPAPPAPAPPAPAPPAAPGP